MLPKYWRNRLLQYYHLATELSLSLESIKQNISVFWTPKNIPMVIALESRQHGGQRQGSSKSRMRRKARKRAGTELMDNLVTVSCLSTRDNQGMAAFPNNTKRSGSLQTTRWDEKEQASVHSGVPGREHTTATARPTVSTGHGKLSLQLPTGKQV